MFRPIHSMSKHDKDILAILSKDEMKSTNQVLQELQSKTKKAINWHALYRTLMELALDNKAEKIKVKAGFFWKKK
jgi:hypothetical protein